MWPRFFLQIDHLAENSFTKEDFDKKSKVYFDKVMPEITNFYDVYHRFLELNQAYKEGIHSGQYYSFDHQNRPTHNRIPENEIIEQVKSFFIRGKMMLVAFMEDEIIEDNSFCVRNFYYCDLKKFENRRQEYSQASDGRYVPLINLLEKAQNTFLREFTTIRGDIEHYKFTIDKYTIEAAADGVYALEPRLGGKTLSNALEYYYENILDLLEKLLAYFFGINGEIKRGYLKLHVRRDPNYADLLYKYTFAIHGNILMGSPSDVCLYK